MNFKGGSMDSKDTYFIRLYYKGFEAKDAVTFQDVNFNLIEHIKTNPLVWKSLVLDEHPHTISCRLSVSDRLLVSTSKTDTLSAIVDMTNEALVKNTFKSL